MTTPPEKPENPTDFQKSAQDNERVVITEDLLATLRFHRDRTGIAGTTLLKIGHNPPKKLNYRTIFGWLAEEKTTARKVDLDYVLKTWETLPSVEFIEITDEIVEELNFHKNRTGVGSISLLKLATNPPEGLDHRKIDKWFSKPQKPIRKDHLDFVLSTWKALPPPVEITEEIRDTLRKLKKLTRTAPLALLRYREHEIPAGLTANLIQRWLYRGTRTARKDHLAYVLKLWGSIAALQKEQSTQKLTKIDVASETEFLEITHDILEEFHFQRERTGVNHIALLENIRRDNIPQGLNGKIIRQWLCRQITYARKDYLMFVLSSWRALETAPAPLKQKRTKTENYVPITQEIREKLLGYKRESETGAHRLLKEAHNAPAGLTPSIVDSWLSSNTKRARKEHLDYVLIRWKSFANSERNIGYTRLTDEIINHLKAQKERTGIGPMALLAGKRHEMPKGLNSGIIAQWLAGKSKTARKEYVEYVTSRWEGLPDRVSLYVDLDANTMSTLQYHSQRTGIGAYSLLAGRTDIPDTLTGAIVNAWYSKGHRTKKVLKSHLEYVLSLWEKVPDNSFVEISSEWRDAVHKEYLRTGVAPHHLLKGREGIPYGLSAVQIGAWYNGNTKSTYANLLQRVLEIYRELPDRSNSVG